AENDALLHKLIHTKLLSGSLNPELDLSPAERKKALAGRVIEVAGETKLGRGDRTIRQEEHNRASKHVRDGLREKQKQRDAKKLEEAKNLGNYYPGLKKLYDDSSSGAPKQREKGLRMGVGKFENGMLKLSRDDIAKVQGSSSRGGRGGRGGRGSRGRGGGKRGGRF
ncbi:hypothetical protein SISNIDRAFT_405834, partial [Sistotremastrum niveocremeum HHB9708]